MQYNYGNVPRETVVWACAYTTNNSEKTMCFKKKPVQGKIIGNTFYELKRNGDIKKSSGVSIWSRIYFDTEEECVIGYNELINKQVEKLQKLIEDALAEKIELTGIIRKDL